MKPARPCLSPVPAGAAAALQAACCLAALSKHSLSVTRRGSVWGPSENFIVMSWEEKTASGRDSQLLTTCENHMGSFRNKKHCLDSIPRDSDFTGLELRPQCWWFFTSLPGESTEQPRGRTTGLVGRGCLWSQRAQF